MKINPGRNKAIIFTSARVKNPMGYSLGDKKFLKEAVVNNRVKSLELI